MKNNYWDNLIEGVKRERRTKWIFVKLVLLVLIVLYVYGIFYYHPVKEVYDECSRTSAVNNCYTIRVER